MKNQKFKFRILSVALAALVSFTSCEKDDDTPQNTPIPDHSPELITKVRLIFSDIEDDAVVFAVDWSDQDGPGGNDPVIEDINLEYDRIYAVSIEIYDASNPDDVENLTSEIQDEAVDHQFFFLRDGDLDGRLEISYEDEDVNGHPIGLVSSWTTTGTTDNPAVVTVVLRHEPIKAIPGVQQGNIEEAGGETDVQIDFNVNIQ